MNRSEKLEYFNENVEKLISSKQNKLISFLNEASNYSQFNESFKLWPDEIKLMIVDNYTKETT